MYEGGTQLMQNNLTKRAVLGGLVASHLGQNLIGKPIANSAWFRKDVAKAGIMGALKKESPRSAKSYAKDASFGVIAPEVNIAKNTAYSEGRSKAKELHNKIRLSPEYKAARVAQKANNGKLNLPMSIKRDLVKQRQSAMQQGNITKSEFKELSSLPKGNRMPSSTRAAVGANAALALVPGGASTAAVNAAKLTSGTKAYADSKLGKWVNEKLFTNPLKRQVDKGVAGKAFDTKRNIFESVVINPFTAKAEKEAYNVGKKHSSKINRAKEFLNKQRT